MAELALHCCYFGAASTRAMAPLRRSCSDGNQVSAGKHGRRRVRVTYASTDCRTRMVDERIFERGRSTEHPCRMQDLPIYCWT